MKEFLADMARQIWILIGLFSAWLVLTGAARKAVGVSIVVGVILWAATHKLRMPKNENRDRLNNN